MYQNQQMMQRATSDEILEAQSIDACADKGYGSASDIVMCIAQGITPHVVGVNYDVCLPANLQVPEGLSNMEVAAENITKHNNGLCVYLPDRNVAICPSIVN